MEDSSSAGPATRRKKSLSRDPSEDEAVVKPPAKRQVRQEVAEPPETAQSSPTQLPTNSPTNTGTIFAGQEPNKMNQSQEISQWQPQSHQDFHNGDGNYLPEAGYVQNEEGYYEEDGLAGQDTGQYQQNQIVLTLTYSLMNQVRQTARMEGVLPEDILIELIAEGVARRVFEDAQRPAPSHLMTRTGYVAPDANGNVQQPQLSHHGMQGNNRGNHNNHNNRRYNQNNRGGNSFQGRNRQNNHFNNKQRNGK